VVPVQGSHATSYFIIPVHVRVLGSATGFTELNVNGSFRHFYTVYSVFILYS